MIFSLSDAPHARLLPSQEEMKSFDQRTIASGIPARELMERAGVEVFRELKERFSFELYSNGRVVVLAGPGNNGGDGLVIARHLKDHGYEVVVVLASSSRYSAELLEQLGEFRGKEGPVFLFPEPAAVGDFQLELLTAEELGTLVKGASVLVDSMLGTGQQEAPRGAIAELLQCVHAAREGESARARIVAVDLPTGINGDTGEVYPGALPVDLTVAVELIKRGMMQYPARSLCGDIWVVKIGLECDSARFSVLDRSQVRAPGARRAESHKGDFGSVLVIGGSEQMPGAPVLSALSALRCGAGTVTKAHLRGTALPGLAPEIMLAPVGDGAACFEPAHLNPLRDSISRASALILGPGLARGVATAGFVREVISFARKEEIPTVVDADGLNALGERLSAIGEGACHGMVLTPHPGEAARLLGLSAVQVQSDRYAAAAEIARLSGATVVLKGAATVIASGERGWVNTTGNSWLATAGSGDVLCGVIAAFLARGYSCLEAACAGVLFHGTAADMLEQQGAVPLLAGDLCPVLARLIGAESRAA